MTYAHIFFSEYHSAVELLQLSFGFNIYPIFPSKALIGLHGILSGPHLGINQVHNY